MGTVLRLHTAGFSTAWCKSNAIVAGIAPEAAEEAVAELAAVHGAQGGQPFFAAQAPPSSGTELCR